MSILLNLCQKLLHKLRNFYSSPDTVNYHIHVGDCYYSEEKQEYIAVLHTTGKRGSFKVPVREIVANQQLLSQIHPIQASSLGWMAREAYYKFAANDSQYQAENFNL